MSFILNFILEPIASKIIEHISKKIYDYLFKWYPKLLTEACFTPIVCKIYPFETYYSLEINIEHFNPKLISSKKGYYQSANTGIIYIDISELAAGKHKMVIKDLTTNRKYKIKFWIDDEVSLLLMNNQQILIKDITVLTK